MNRTVEQMVCNVQRSLREANPPIHEILQALDSANKKIHGAFSWPWSVKETNVLIPPPYAQGLVSAVDGTNVVTLAGGTWDPTWIGRRIQFGESNVDYVVVTIAANSLTLAQPLNMGHGIVGRDYHIYQDTFFMPDDWEPGGDLFLSQPIIRFRIRHISQMQFEQNGMVLKQLSTNLTSWYADGGFMAYPGTTTYRHTIRFMPPISQAGEYRMVYRAVPPQLSQYGMVSAIPEGFEDVLELHAEEELRRIFSLPGRQEAAAKAAGTLKIMRRKVTNTPMDDQPAGGQAFGDSSISQWGMSILPWSN